MGLLAQCIKPALYGHTGLHTALQPAGIKIQVAAHALPAEQCYTACF